MASGGEGGREMGLRYDGSDVARLWKWWKSKEGWRWVTRGLTPPGKNFVISSDTALGCLVGGGSRAKNGFMKNLRPSHHDRERETRGGR